jgi:uncharacterized membrane protein (UPF0127 family)
MICRNKGRFAAAAAFVLAVVTAGAMRADLASAQSPCPLPAQTADPNPIHVLAPAGTIDLRIADNIAKREYGLMCVRSLPPHTGMIFVFNDGDNLRDFWMKNTLIPLDMVFVSRSGLVNDVSANVPATNTDTPDRLIPHREGTGTFVIELAAGEAARAGIKPGTTLAIRGVRIPRE